jgi:2,3-bisphosphoglycerate-independent phosphoglycerate mutase
MLTGEGKAFTAHTTNPVHLVLVDDSRKHAQLRDGVLGDIAPTILQLLGVAQPPKMTGRSLLTT